MPEATIIAIEHAERFGLSQDHQLLVVGHGGAAVKLRLHLLERNEAIRLIEAG